MRSWGWNKKFNTFRLELTDPDTSASAAGRRRGLTLWQTRALSAAANLDRCSWVSLESFQSAGKALRCIFRCLVAAFDKLSSNRMPPNALSEGVTIALELTSSQRQLAVLKEFKLTIFQDQAKSRIFTVYPLLSAPSIVSFELNALSSRWVDSERPWVFVRRVNKCSHQMDL